MATTYTPNYHLGKQTDKADKFNMTIITDDMDIIDAALADKEEKPQAATAQITNTTLEEFFAGTMTGELAAEITGSSAAYGIVRAYTLDTSVYMQIAEVIDGTRLTRSYTSDSWSSWA